jgi:hypothetical protein
MEVKCCRPFSEYIPRLRRAMHFIDLVIRPPIRATAEVCLSSRPATGFSCNVRDVQRFKDQCLDRSQQLEVG